MPHGYAAQDALGERMLFRDYVSEWQRSARINVSDGWKQTQDLMLRLHILPILGEHHLDKIRPEDISKVLTVSADKNHSKNTTKQIYLLLSKLFSDAIHFFEYLEKSPVKKRHHAPKVPKKEAKYLTPDDVYKLLDHAKYHWSIQAIVIQLFLGLRVGEVIALKWKDIDLHNRNIIIRSKWNRKTKQFDEFPKNKKQKRLPIAGDVLIFLQDLYITLKPGPEDFVCTSAGGQMLSYNAYQKTIKILCRQAGVPEISSHGFRHSCSVLWKRQGANLDDRQSLLNHDSQVSTKTYDHDDDFRLQVLAGAVMKLLR